MKLLSPRHIAVLAATTLYAAAPSASGPLTTAAIGAAAVSILSVSEAEAKGKLRGASRLKLRSQVKKEGSVRLQPAKRCARTLDGGCR